MALDPTTESIAHFIGLFQIAQEEARLRDSYDQFDYQSQAAALADLPSIDTDFTAPYDPHGHDPSLHFTPEPQSLIPGGGAPQDAAAGTFELPVGPVAFPGRPSPAGAAAGSGDISDAPSAVPGLPPAHLRSSPTEPLPDSPAAPTLPLPPPNSVATATHQQARLSDDDTLGPPANAAFADPGSYLSRLEALADSAATLGAPAADSLPAGGIASGEAALSFAPSPAESAPEGAHRATLHGENATGLYVDGAPAEQMPLWPELRPTFFAAKEEDEADQTDTTPGGLSPGEVARDTPLAGDDPVEDAAGAPGHQPGHEIVAGANRAINEAHIRSKWVDAPVIAVEGDAVTRDAISQVNVLVDRDQATHAGEPAASSAVNGAEIASAAAPAGDGDAFDAGTFPNSWAVARIEHDLSLTNEVRQVTFATDTDRAEISFTATETRIGLGENLLTNATSLQELGFGYDLILVGGDMIDIDTIHQTNVLLDNDIVAVPGPMFGAISTADNTLLNQASLTQTGEQSYTALTDPFAKAIEAFREGAETLDRAVARDARFEGDDQLAVLSIGGDFISTNVIDQTNIVGDADQILLQAEAFARSAGKGFELTTGSNGLLNTASVHEIGIDSEVLVGGEVYSDALLHQAELIDTDAAPTGVGMSALASEAVAFLADDMTGPPSAETDSGAAPAEDGSIPLDVMQTMLA